MDLEMLRQSKKVTSFNMISFIQLLRCADEKITLFNSIKITYKREREESNNWQSSELQHRGVIDICFLALLLMI